MKITNQTADALALKEGDATGVMMGIVLVLVGVGLGVYTRFVVGTPLWFALGLFVVGLVVVFMSSSITVDINKTSGQIVYQTKRIIGGKSATFAIGDVLRVETRKSWRTESSNTGGNRGISVPREVLFSQSVIVFKDGQELALDRAKSSSSGMSIGPGVMMSGSGKEVAIANQVATFMGVPFQEVAPPNGPMSINIGGGNIQL
jgi:hypothetical protein